MRLISGWISLCLASMGTLAAMSDAAAELQTEMTVPWTPISQLLVRLNLREGNLIVSAGTDDLTRAVFTYREGKERPQLLFESHGDRADVTVKSKERIPQSEVYLTNRVPVDLLIDSQSGNQRLILDGIMLQNLTIGSGKGNIAIHAEQTHPLLEAVEMRHHIGNLHLDFSGDFARLKKMAVESSSGEMVVNLAGLGAVSANVTLDLGAGNLSLVVPSRVGVAVVVDAEQGEVVTKGMVKKSDHLFVSEGDLEESPVVEIRVHAGHGNVFLQRG